MVKAQTLKGFRDFLPKEARKRQYVIDTLKEVFELYGFEPLETPTLEYEEILAGKYGEEGDKLMYRFEDNGKRKVAMRYDQTVPLARVVAEYGSTNSPLLPMPFKRYQIQNVFRAENTQKGRFREFLQCDADIVGSSSPLADAEVIAVAAKALEKLGFTNYKILLNDRKVFSRLVDEQLLTQDEMVLFVRAIDKLKKIGDAGVLEELTKNGFEKSRSEKLLKLIQEQEKTDTINDIHLFLENLHVPKERFEFSPTLARGLDYYTGLIFEIEIEGYSAGSVCGGGRYDNLIGMFSPRGEAGAGKDIPAVGFAFGFDRVLEALEELKLFPTELQSTKVLVTIFNPELKEKSIETATLLRSNGVNTELFLDENASLEKQLKYANQKQIPYVVVIGPEEANSGMVNLKIMNTREQKTITKEALPNEII